MLQLWVGHGSRAAEEKHFFDSHLAPFYRIEQVSVMLFFSLFLILCISCKKCILVIYVHPGHAYVPFPCSFMYVLLTPVILLFEHRTPIDVVGSSLISFAFVIHFLSKSCAIH